MKRWAALLISIAAIVSLVLTLTRKKEPQVLWSRDTESGWPNSPAISTNGTLHFGDYNGNVFALSPDGGEMWQTNIGANTGGAFVTTSAIGPHGNLYVITGGGGISAMTDKGLLKWSRALGAIPDSQIAIDLKGTLYVSSVTNSLHAIDADGSVLWHFKANDQLNGSPVIGPEATIYVSCYVSNLYAIGSNGALKWQWTTDSVMLGAPIPGRDGSVYVAAYPALNALSMNGSLRWSLTNESVTSLLVLDDQGRLYCATDRGICAVDTIAAKTLWTLEIGEVTQSMAALGTDGCLYVSSDASTLYAIESSTGRVRWTFTRKVRYALFQRALEWLEFAFGGFSQRSTTIYPCAFTLSHDRILYAVMPDQRIYAVAVPAGLATNAPWPMFQHDVRHTSSLGQPADR